MNNKLGCDTFVFGNTMAEDLSADWESQEFSQEVIDNGILFKPYTNILYSEFFTQINEDKRYCITLIGTNGNHKSYSDLTFKQAETIIEETKMELHLNDEDYLSIFNMADGISLSQYKEDCLKELENKFLGYTYCREGHTINSESFLKDVNEILGGHNGGFKMYDVFTDKTFYYYSGVVFINTEIDGVTKEQAQKYFEEQLLSIDKELGCPQ